jgi:hypothetical protein
MRPIFLQADKVKGWNQQSGYLTMDGLHPTATGADLEFQAFTQQLFSWYATV